MNRCGTFKATYQLSLYRIYMGIARVITIPLMHFCRILKQKNPPERDDVNSSNKVKTANSASARVLLPANKCLFCEKNRIMKEQHKCRTAGQTCDENSWRVCYRCRPKETRSAHLFACAKYLTWLFENQALPFLFSERLERTENIR